MHADYPNNGVNFACLSTFQDVRERLDLARETYGLAREEGRGRVSAGLAALQAAAAKDGQEQSSDGIKERLAKIVDRDQARDEPEADTPEAKRESVQERPSSLLDRSKPVQVEQEKDEPELDDEKERHRDRDIGDGHGL